MVKSKRRYLRCQLFVKRFFDIILAEIFFILSLPVILIAAFAVRLESRGPVIFRQVRVGKDKQTFIFYKLRSMYLGSSEEPHKEYIKKLITAEPEIGRNEKAAYGFGYIESQTIALPVYKLKDDFRVTRVGRFIRKTSIDELPQLFNVIKGDMSLVGPRPAIPYELEYHSPEMMERFSFKPGITGLWQVSGRSGLTYRQMVNKDILYIRNWSIWLDLKILFKTISIVFRVSRAY